MGDGIYDAMGGEEVGKTVSAQVQSGNCAAGVIYNNDLAAGAAIGSGKFAASSVNENDLNDATVKRLIGETAGDRLEYGTANITAGSAFMIDLTADFAATKSIGLLGVLGADAGQTYVVEKYSESGAIILAASGDLAHTTGDCAGTGLWIAIGSP